MSIQRALVFAAAAAAIAVPTASAGATQTITISHQMKGCHRWQWGDAKPKVNLAVTIKAGTAIRFVDNDIMPHRLIQQAGPKLALVKPNMKHMSASTSVRFARAGVYRFTTKAGEDYAWVKSMETIGEDNILHLTVHVK